MSAGWGAYSVLILAGALSAALPAGLWVLSRLLSGGSRKRRVSARPMSGVELGELSGLVSPDAVSLAEVKTPQPEDRWSPGMSGKRFNSRFYVGISAATLVVQLAMILMPLAVAIRGSPENASALKVAILMVSAFLLTLLAYAVRKGDLSWLKTTSDRQ